MRYLHQEEILNSIDKHLDGLKDTVKSALIAAVVFWWAGLNQEDPLKIFGMSIPLSFALYFAVIFYLFINLSILDKLIRLSNLLGLIDDQNLLKSVSKISLYSFFANPFSYFGNSFSSKVNSSKGFGVLIIIWWICNSSLYSLSKNSMTVGGIVLQGCFLLIGLSSMLVIGYISKYLSDRLKSIDKNIHNEIKKVDIWRNVVAFICIGIGGIIAYITSVLSIH